MSKLFWKALKLTPVLLAATLLLERTAAAETPTQVAPQAENKSEVKPLLVAQSQSAIAQAQREAIAEPKITNTTEFSPALKQAKPATDNTMQQVEQYNLPPTAPISQVTSVSQLSDVQPTDWAFQALQSLVERYGCIAGYPDGTYRGNRALTRYEFAAGLNACLDRVNELIATATADLVTREDLATLQRLQEEFSAELATLRGRVDALEARTAELEANQFSTTTKLTGEVVVAASDVFGDERAVLSGQADGSRGETEINTTFSDRVRLNFDTSFFGTDLLRTRLQARNIVPYTRTGTAGAAGDTGTAMTRLGFDGGATGSFGENDVALDDFFYRFQLSEAANVKIDFAQSEFNDNVYTFNPLFESSGRGAISRFGRFNPIYRQGGDGSGITLNLNPNGPIGISVGYLTPKASNPANGFGLFDGDYAALAQVAFRPSQAFNIGLTYAHTYDNAKVAAAPLTANSIGVSGGTGSDYANNPFNNAATSANHYAVEASLRASSNLTVSGWAGLTYATAEDGKVANVTRGDDARIFNYAVSLALTDIGREGSVLGLIFGQPPKVTDNDFGAGSAREDDDTSYHLEALYRFPLTENIEITPGLLVILNPEHNDNNDNIYVGTLRTTFRF